MFKKKEKNCRSVRLRVCARVNLISLDDSVAETVASVITAEKTKAKFQTFSSEFP